MISRRTAWSFACCVALGGASLVSDPRLSWAQANSAASPAASSSTAQPTPPIAFVPIAAGSDGPRVIELQVLLRDLSYYQGAATGQFDGPTGDALAAFQSSQLLPPSRILDATTWDRLQFTQTGAFSAPTAASSPTPSATPSVRAASAPPIAKAQSAAQSAAKAGSKAPIAKPADARMRWLLLGTAGLGLGAGTYGLVRATRQTPKVKAKSARARSLTPSNNPAIASPAELVSPLQREAGPRDLGQRDLGQRDLEPRLEPHDLAIATDEDVTSDGANYGVTRSANRLPRIDIVEALMVDIQSVDAEKRRKAIWELGQRGDSRAVQPLVNLMAISDSRQRSLILASLSEIGIQTLKPMKRALAMSLQDENADVRKNAIRDLTRIYDLVGQISQLLNFATEDNDGEVRETAQWALGQLNRIRPASTDTSPLLQQSVSPPELFSEDVKLQERKADYS
jgi:peptidoglycan hydrolase-like protein with peptidoglycan-binding domain